MYGIHIRYRYRYNYLIYIQSVVCISMPYIFVRMLIPHTSPDCRINLRLGLHCCRLYGIMDHDESLLNIVMESLCFVFAAHHKGFLFCVLRAFSLAV